MSRGRRKALIQVAERVALVLVLLDLVLYFAVVRPVRSLRTSEETSYRDARNRVRELGRRIVRLEEYKAAVPGTEEQLNAFLRSNAPSRRQGFSWAARLVRRLTERSGVRLVGVSYKLDSPGDEPLQRLGIEVDVDGPFTDVLSFAHALETAGDLVLLRTFTLAPGEGDSLSLRVGTDLYLTP